jgi:hypothetical protein
MARAMDLTKTADTADAFLHSERTTQEHLLQGKIAI